MEEVQTRQTGAQRRAQHRQGGSSGPAAPVRQVKRLFVVRESTAYKWELFAAMMLQVLERHLRLPSVATVLGHGVLLVQPGPKGASLRHELGVQALRAHRKGRGRPRRPLAQLLIIDEDAFMLSQVSASRTDEDGTNAFGAALAAVILELRPEELHTGPASRFGRSTEVFSRVANAVKAVDCRVYSDEAPEGLDLTQPNDALRWDMYGLIAAADVREILKRLTIGRLLDARAGRWPLGPRHIVMGYECDGAKRPRPTRDARVVQWVRELIRMGADPALTLDDIVDALGTMGLTTPKLQELYGAIVDQQDDLGSDVVAEYEVSVMKDGPNSRGDGRPLDSASALASAVRPREVVERLFGHLETYLTGNYRFELTCPVPGIKEWCSTPVHRQEGDPFGAFRVDIALGLPEGGWAPEESIRAAIALRCTPDEARPTGGAAHEEDHKPFSGFASWLLGGAEYVLSAKFPTYHLLVRDAVCAGSGWHDGPGVGTVVGAMAASDFHADFAQQALATLGSEGFDVEALTFATRPVASGLMISGADHEFWRTQIAQLRAANSALVQSEGTARGRGDLDSAEAYAEGIRENSAKIAEFRRLLEEQPVQVPSVPRQADVTGLPELIKLLQAGRAQYPAAVSTHLHRVVHGLRLVADPFWVSWSCELRLVTDAGLVRVPVSGQVRNVMRPRGQERARFRQARVDHLAGLWTEDGLSIEDVAAAVRWSDPGSVERILRRKVIASWPVTPAMRHALIDCPVPQVRRVLFQHVQHVPATSPWAQLVVDAYTGMTVWPQRWNADVDGARRRVVEALREHCGVSLDRLDEGLSVQQLVEASGVSTGFVSRMAGVAQGAAGDLRPSKQGWVLEKDVWTRATPERDRRIRLRRCTWCGTRSVTIVCRAPELGGIPMLCHSCLRRPGDPEGVQFPESYRGPLGYRGRSTA